VRGKSELLRIALDGSHGAPVARLDREGRMGGRGAYLCRAPEGEAPLRECAVAAVRRGAIQRTLRARATLDDKLVESVGR
jgi:predicted RNA-binding protein YlxR (DUF448 family)